MSSFWKNMLQLRREQIDSQYRKSLLKRFGHGKRIQIWVEGPHEVIHISTHPLETIGTIGRIVADRIGGSSYNPNDFAIFHNGKRYGCWEFKENKTLRSLGIHNESFFYWTMACNHNSWEGIPSFFIKNE